MIRSFTLWLKKRRLKKEYAKEFEELLVMVYFGDTDFERRDAELEAYYLKLGLTEEDLKEARNSIGPIRVE